MGKRDRQGYPPGAKASQDAAAASQAAAGGAARRWYARRAGAGAAIFVVLLVAYLADGRFLYGNDAKPNVYLPASLLSGGGMSFTPSEYPFMFRWSPQTPQGPATHLEVMVNNWDEYVPGQPFTYRQLREAGRLADPIAKYYLVRSMQTPPGGELVCVNTFGPGAGLTALPVYAVLHLAVGGDLRSHPAALWYGAKAAGALLVAGSAVFVFLTARVFTTTGRAALVALAYGLGTGVWSTSSQTLWQHGPNEFFLAMGAYFWVRAEASWKHAAACGAALAAAVACRPTSVVVAAAAGVYLLARWATARRRALVPYVLAALPIAAGLAAYNTHYLGAPWNFGQEKVGHNVAVAKTGKPDLWQTPLWVGAAGLMVSPSRGLLVFSPFMGFAIAGLVMLWTRRRYAALWPLTAAMVVLLGVAFKWFDWWGGWCYGPRPIVDTMPLFVLGLIPVIDWVWRRRAVLAVFVVLVAWSAVVQAVGAFSYDMFGWNKRSIATVYLAGQSEPVIVTSRKQMDALAARATIVDVQEKGQDIDDREFRHRLWSLSDNQILYYLANFDEARDARKHYCEIWLKEPSR